MAILGLFVSVFLSASPLLAQSDTVGCKDYLGDVLDRLSAAENEIICTTESGWRMGLRANMPKSVVLSDGSIYQLLARSMSPAQKTDDVLGLSFLPVATNVWEVITSKREKHEGPVLTRYYIWARDYYELPFVLSRFNETDVRVFRCHVHSAGFNSCGTFYNVSLCPGYVSPAWKNPGRIPEPGLGVGIRAERDFLELLSSFNEMNDHAEDVLEELFAHSCK